METSDTWSDGSPPGGVGTITRPAAEPAAASSSSSAAAVPAAEPRVRRGGRARPAAQGARGRQALAPDAVPRHAGPHPAAPHPAAPHRAGQRGAAPDLPQRAATLGEPHNTQRMPFFLVLCGLLGGALISALVISTTLAEGSYRITRLQQANSALARQRQILQAQVAAEQSAQVIEQRALELGMRPVGELRFVDLKNGKIETDAGRGAVAEIHVPGYTP
jgi:hypothetical protein